MCNRARLSTETEMLHERFGATWAAPVPNRWSIELAPKGRAPVIRSAGGGRIIDVMGWDLLGGNGPSPRRTPASSRSRRHSM